MVILSSFGAALVAGERGFLQSRTELHRSYLRCNIHKIEDGLKLPFLRASAISSARSKALKPQEIKRFSPPFLGAALNLDTNELLQEMAQEAAHAATSSPKSPKSPKSLKESPSHKSPDR